MWRKNIGLQYYHTREEFYDRSLVTYEATESLVIYIALVHRISKLIVICDDNAHNIAEDTIYFIVSLKEEERT